MVEAVGNKIKRVQFPTTIPVRQRSRPCNVPSLEMNERLSRIRHVALDMDGTIYRGGTMFAATGPFLALLGRLGIGYTFLTNNPSKNISDYLARKLNGKAPE